MTPSTKSDADNALNSIKITAVDKELGEIAKIRDFEHSEGRLSAKIEFAMPLEREFASIRESIETTLTEQDGMDDVSIELSTRIDAHGVQANLKPLGGVKNLIAVASGKGGVGKSTVAVNLALALAADGARTGLLDADIYGPSQPHMVGLAGERPISEDGKSMEPLEALGLEVMSIGFLVDQDQPMVWRGPMVTSALNQLLTQTNWGDLDYLIVDMPPGTGDIQLTLSQQVPVTGAVIVTTPQDIAAIDARKGLAMFRKVSIPVLGVIENMSTWICPSCGQEEAIFGSGGAGQIADDFEVDILGRLPLDASIRAQTDAGEPTVYSDPDSKAADAYRAAARRMSAALSLKRKDYSSKFPNIVVENG